MSEVLRTARRTGFGNPVTAVSLGLAAARWGATLGAIYGAAALRHPTKAAIVDHRGALTFGRLDARSTALARGLRAYGMQAGQHLGLLCRNHRDFAEANLAAAKAGLPVVYLNTGFAPAQLHEVIAREGITGLVVDHDLLSLLDGYGFSGPVVVSATDHPVASQHTMYDARRIGRFRLDPLPALRPRQALPVLLTSGTTGTPKGARRGGRTGLGGAEAAAGFLQTVPYARGDTFVVTPPLFHAWGLSQLVLAASLGGTVVVAPRFEPKAVLDAVARHRATVLVVVPTILQRLLAEPSLDRRRLSSLRIVASSGSALPAPVATEWMDRVGDVLYNVYGSTEVGQATVATPADLRAAPGTAGRVVPGVRVATLDTSGAPVPAGQEGAIFVGGGSQFSHYTGGGTKDVRDGLMASGDTGRFDREGRLFVTGRTDDMIVSGGENVFPGEVEDLLLTHPAVADAAVVGVADEAFGQRLAAFVVCRPGRDVQPAALRDLVSSQLARHKVPRDVTFVEELPRNPAGKVLRGQLRTQAEDAHCGPSRNATG
jgi:fatty-acyl-CoA synthase